MAGGTHPHTVDLSVDAGGQDNGAVSAAGADDVLGDSSSGDHGCAGVQLGSSGADFE